MGPTQASLDDDSSIPTSIDEAGDLFDPCRMNSNVEFEIVKIALPADAVNGQENDLKLIVSEIQKLARYKHNQVHIRTYKKVWFEGFLAEKCHKLTGLAAASATKCGEGATGEDNPLFLCVQREKYKFVSLARWLEGKRESVLCDSQVLHVISQLAAALSVIVESGVAYKNEVTLSEIHLVEDEGTWTSSQVAPNLFPTLKLSIFHFESLIASYIPDDTDQLQENVSLSTSERINSESLPLAQLLSRVASELLQNKKWDTGTNKSAEYLKILQEISYQEANVSKFKTIASKLQQLNDKYKNGFTINMGQSRPIFIGREAEVKNLLTILTESHNKLIVVHGAPGIGKSELITQVVRQMLDRQRESGSELDVICFDASSSDSLTASVYACAAQRKLRIQTRDYMGNPRPIKEIFLEMLVLLSESDLLLVFENANVLTVDLLDLIQVYKENSTASSTITSSSCHHHGILLTRELWASCPFLDDCDCTTLKLSPLSNADALLVLRTGHSSCGAACSSQDPTKESDLNQLCDYLGWNPAALNVVLKLTNSKFPLECQLTSLLTSLENFRGKYPELQNSDLQPACLAYAFSVRHLYESLGEEQRPALATLLSLLQMVDGESGVFVDILIEVLIQLQTSGGCFLNGGAVMPLLLSLRERSIIKVTDGVIKLSDWAQSCIKVSLSLIKNSPVTGDTSAVLSAYYIILSSKSVEADCWKLICHAVKLWKSAARVDVDVARHFSALPDLVAKLAKSFKKLELVTGFLKDAIDIFTVAYSSPYDIHVLKLKFLLAAESLLPLAKVNEAFVVFKVIQENCCTEPRDYLMVKLKSLIELGKIHISRQEYDKAISCFQHVQVFSVQKISILHVDSEPTVLCSRLFHGQAHLEQGNLEEAKKIILQVIPLMERYTGPEHEHVRMLILQAKYFLAVLLRKMGDLVNALMMQTKVAEERDRIFGGKHPDTWASKREMCMLFSSYDNQEKALMLLRELLEVQEEVLGAPSNRHSLATMNSIAEIEAKLGNFDDALELYEAIDLIEQQVLPENDEMRILSQLNQAEVLMSLGQYKEAIDIFDLIYTLRSTSEEVSSHNAKLCESILGKRGKAERSMEVLGNYWLSLTPENVDDPSELAALAKKHEVAIQLMENQDNQGSLRFLREVLEDCGHLEDTNRFHLNVKADLARVLGLVGRFNESFSVYKEIIPLMDATFGETDELTMLCKDTMGQVFLFSGNQFLKRQMSNLKWFLL